MGTGSDVAKSASDIVLTDDNFASIMAAIEEGRRSFDNIQSFVLHLLATNVIQGIVLLVGLAFKDQENLSVFPLSPGTPSVPIASRQYRSLTDSLCSRSPLARRHDRRPSGYGPRYGGRGA